MEKECSGIVNLASYKRCYDNILSSFGGTTKKKILLVTSHTTHITTVLNVKLVINSKALVEDKAKYRLH
jgi:hypothetical protein